MQAKVANTVSKEIKFEPSVAELEILFNIMDSNEKGYVNVKDMLRIANVKNESLGLTSTGAKTTTFSKDN